jgi:predicted Fe-S protein YdhL (DUF1289 family)
MPKKKEITLNEHLKKIQSKGGKARWADMTPEERSEVARKNVQARWAKVKAAKQVTETPQTGS